ncbi:class C sortase [Jeotgalibaca sp. A127]|uniref:class C sortase n=1 Tax=Jeotgalibaca sp. A127 TaxID=3457324 RepID=UPI003FD5111C
MNKQARKKWLLGLVFLVGLGIFLYPNLSQIYAQISQYQIISQYKRQQEEMDEKLKNIELEKLNDYNESLMENDITYVDPFEENELRAASQTPAIDQRLGETLGYIAIPKIGINIPIYRGTTDYILQRGIGLLEKSSMPVGGEGTHAALTGHRGLPQSKLFTDLDEMAVGDIFYIHSVAGTLAYEVEKVQTVLPHETESLKIQAGKDLVTLITCTPYMINTHRILVTGARVPFVPAQEAEPLMPSERIFTTVEENKPIATVIAAVVLSLVLLGTVMYLKTRKKAGGKS